MAEMLDQSENYREAEDWLGFKLSSGRCARAFVAQIAQGFENKQPIKLGDYSFWLDPHCVLDEIEILERTRSTRSRTKTEKRLRYGELAGLYHKHWTQASFMPVNLKNEAEKNGEMRILRALRRTFEDGEYDGKILGDDQAKAIAHELIISAYEDRTRGSEKGQNGSLTGQWIVYAKHGGANYYLTLGLHDEGNHSVFARCVPALLEFPELRAHRTFSKMQV